MPRIARQTSATGYYHVLGRGHDRQAIFLENSDYQRYLDEFARFKEKFPCRCYHFCLMPNHFHLLLETERVETLTALMRRVLRAYQFYWRRRYGLVGHLWQGRFKSFPIERESYLLECGRYIERNPVRAGLCQMPEDYPWSSAKTYLGDQKDKEKWRFVNPDPTYEALGQTDVLRRQRYREFIEQSRAYDPFVDSQLQQLM